MSSKTAGQTHNLKLYTFFSGHDHYLTNVITKPNSQYIILDLWTLPPSIKVFAYKRKYGYISYYLLFLSSTKCILNTSYIGFLTA